MNKNNVFKSSSFFMNDGDILRMIIIDEQGDPFYVDLMGEDSDVVPNQPTVEDATDITSSSFTANWNFMENSTGYYLDVAEDSAFTSMVAGYDNKDVGNVISDSVSGLTQDTYYYYRIRAYNENGVSVDSSTITTQTDEVLVVFDVDNSETPPVASFGLLGEPQYGYTVTITCPTTWTSAISHGDIHLDVDSGSGNAVVTISCDAGGYAEPLGTVTFSSDGVDFIIEVWRGY